MRVVLTRERGHNDELRSWIPPGWDVREVPVTTTEFYDESRVRESLAASPHRGEFRALVVTSARSALYVNAARAFLAPGAHVLSVGTQTARALENESLAVDVVGTAGAQELSGDIDEGPVLLLGAAAMREELSEQLRARGIEVEHLACYETVGVRPSPEDAEVLRAAQVVFIGAPSAWRAARDFVDEGAWVVVPGRRTAEVVVQDHARVIEGWNDGLAAQLSAL